MSNPYHNETLKTIRNLSSGAKQLFAEILNDEVNVPSVFGSIAWDELTDHDLINHWSDDTGAEFVEIGNQL